MEYTNNNHKNTYTSFPFTPIHSNDSNGQSSHDFNVTIVYTCTVDQLNKL